MVRLPFKEEVGLFGDSLQQAGNDYVVFFFRLEMNPELYKKYNNFMNNFFNFGHMEEVLNNEFKQTQYNFFYMPNHCVFKDSSTTIKVRVVFEASAKTTISLMVDQRQIDGWT